MLRKALNFNARSHFNIRACRYLRCVLAMPQHCRGMDDPAGGSPRPCIFATNGLGGPSRVGSRRRDGAQCAFCCPAAFERASGTRLGKRHLTKRLKQWRESKSPTYEAAFTFGIPGLLLPFGLQLKLRHRAGEKPNFPKGRSWLHKKPSRLEVYLHGKPIPGAPDLSLPAIHFLTDCQKQIKRSHKHWLCRRLRAPIWHYNNLRAREAKLMRNSLKVKKRLRQEWWKQRRDIQKVFLKLVAEGRRADRVVETAVVWATDEALLPI